VRLSALTTLLLVSAAACGGGTPGNEESAPSVAEPEVTVVGDVTTVHNRDTPTWSEPRALREEASIGAAAGDEAYLLGGVSALAVAPERIWVADFQTVSVRAYDRDGAHLFDVGREGNGPGEFRRPWAIGVSDDGRLVVRDQLQRRVHVFSGDGELLADWPSERGIRSAVGSDGSVYVMREDIFPNAAGVVTASVLRHAPDGTPGEWVDFPERTPTPAVDAPSGDPDPLPPQMRGRIELMAVFLGIGADWRSTRWVPFAPRVVSEVAPDGSLVAGRADTYRFEVMHPNGSRLAVEKDWTPVAVDPDEADWHTRRITALWRAATDESWTWLGDPIPATKGAFHAIVPALDGSFWVIRELAGERLPGCNDDPADYYGFEEAPCWRQPYVADVFDQEGRFLGSVDMPDGVRYHVRPAIDGDEVVALFEDDEGIAYVKRFRLIPTD